MKKILLTITILMLMVSVGYIVTAYSAYKKDCGQVWCVKSISVEDKGITIEFDIGSVGFQVVYMVEGGKITHLERKDSFPVGIGEKIGWGDGDHAFATLSLNKIEGDTAFITITNKHIRPGKRSKNTKIRKCKIHKQHMLQPLQLTIKSDKDVYEVEKK